MIATCPHCQSGFYISPDLAGNIINCSKCKKQVRAPDRRSRELSSDAPPSDGIPFASVAETKVEVEERLKNETEIKNGLEARLKQEQQRLAELQAQLSKETEARKKAEVTARTFAEKLKDKGIEVQESEIAALKVQDTETEKKLKEAVEAKIKAEEQAKAENQAKIEAIEKLQQEAQLLAGLEAKLKDAEAAKARAELQTGSETQTLAQIETQLREERELKVKLESQWKIEIMAKRKAQTELETEIKAREKAVAEATQLKARLKELETTGKRKSIDWGKGLKRLTILLSFVFAGVAGYFAYINGYIINSHFDRPVHLPFFPKAVYMPIDLVIITVCGFVAAWALYLVEIFIIRGFRKSPTAKINRPVQAPEVEEIMSYSEKKLWRSS